MSSQTEQKSINVINTGTVKIKPDLSYSDSSYFKDFFQKVFYMKPNKTLEKINNQVQCIPRDTISMLYRGNRLKREKFFLVSKDENGMRKYYYTGFQWESMENYRYIEDVEVVYDIVDMIQMCTLDENPIIVNHVIGTKYIDPTDCIGKHQDKMRDIAENTPIIIFSLGDERELVLSEKLENGTFINKTRIIMEAGSMFILGPKTNKELYHEIVPVKEEKIIKRENINTRLSLVLRNIKTLIPDKKLKQNIEISKKDRKSRLVKKQK